MAGGPRVVSVLLALAACMALPANADEIELRGYNGVYENLDADLQPVRQGGLTIRFSSPDHRLTVHRNLVSLTPVGDGTLEAAMEVEFEGSGTLIADIEGAGFANRFTDIVEAPRQTRRVAGRVRLARVEDGYLFTVEAAEPAVRIEIRSGIARQVVDTCKALAMLPFVRLPCGGLAEALRFVTVPIAEPGQQFLLPAAGLRAAEKAFFDRLARKLPATSGR